MTDIPVFGVDGIYERGPANKGTVGVIGLIAPTGERYRLGMRADILDALLVELQNLRNEMAVVRHAQGADTGPLKVQTTGVQEVRVSVDETLGRLQLNVVLDGGATTGFGFPPGRAQELLDGVAAGVLKLSALKKPSTN